MSLGSKAWANDSLRWIISFLNDDSTWKDRPYYKIIVAKACAEDLRANGFHWQCRRVLNHLHLWMKKHKKIDVTVSVRVEI